MKNLMSGIALFAVLAGAAPQDKKDRGKTPELTKKYTAFMKDNAKEMKALGEDIEKDKPEADLKKHLEKIRDKATKARELKYRKDEEEAEKLEGHFEIFLFKLKQDFQDVEWGNKENRLFLHERLQAKCDVCHETLRD
ncbi:MAG: hypothetical protein HY293_12490 [Planctomycetes bacterium]|nr:hypothetical protein [Planctomycetota bacterium]